MDDATLLHRWQEGDPRAGAQLIERHFESVGRFFQNKVGSLAEDLTQRTFLRTIERANHFRRDSSFRTFLFGIARNILLEHFRELQRARRIEPDFGVSSVFDLDPSPSQVVAQRGEQRLLLEALRRIPIELQIAVELFYWENWTIEDLAELQAIPPGTVKSRLHRARRLLTEHLRRLHEGDLRLDEAIPALADSRDTPAGFDG